MSSKIIDICLSTLKREDVKKDIKCISCREEVNKFWGKMVDEWIEIEQTPKKRNVSKKTKAK